MKNILFVLALALAGWLLSWLTTWWYSVALVGLMGGIGLARMRPTMVWSIALLAGALAWGIHASYLNVQNEGLLATRIGDMFGGLHAWTMVLVTALLGGICSGVGAMVGYYGRRAFTTIQ